MKLRVLVTGSRDWPEERADALWTDLTALLRTDGLDILTVVHGRCPTGIDRYTAQWCEAWVPMAGFLGRDPIELQAKASGTRDCMRRAQRAGIETWDRSSTLTTT